MTCISEGIGSGKIKDIPLQEAVKKSWFEFMSINLKLRCSPELSNNLNWHCKSGVTQATMKMINEEFNFYRGLFPLKVFITGPPCSGKTHFARKLNELYGIPHLKIQDIVSMGKSMQGGYGDVVNAKIEELKN